MTSVISITEDEFDATYPLLPNHLNQNAPWVYGDGPGSLFETYGEQLAFVRSQDPRTLCHNVVSHIRFNFPFRKPVAVKVLKRTKDNQ